MTSVFLLLGSIFALVQAANIESDGCIAWLKDNSRQGAVQVEAFCKCEQDGNILYSITTKSSGKSGNSRTVQRGNKLLRAGNPELLAQVSLAGGPRQYSVQLDIYRNESLVARSSSILDVN